MKRFSPRLQLITSEPVLDILYRRHTDQSQVVVFNYKAKEVQTWSISGLKTVLRKGLTICNQWIIQ